MSMHQTLLAAISPREETLKLLMAHVGGKMAEAKAACLKINGDVCQTEHLVVAAADSLTALARIAHQMELMTGRPAGPETSQFVEQSTVELHEMAGHVKFCKFMTGRGDRKRDRRHEN